MTCKEFLASLDDLIDGTVTPELRTELQTHIGKCGHCRLGIYYPCKDGPVFRYDTIKNSPEIWD